MIPSDGKETAWERSLTWQFCCSLKDFFMSPNLQQTWPVTLGFRLSVTFSGKILRMFLQIWHRSPLTQGLTDFILVIKGQCDLIKNYCGHKSRIHVLIMTNIYTNIQWDERMKCWHVSKSQKSASLQHHDVLQKQISIYTINY